MLTSTSSIEQSSSIIPTSKSSFPNTSTLFASSQATTSANTNSNSTGSFTGRYSPSNFYRAAAVAAVTSDPNNRRYMPSTPVCNKIKSKLDFISSFVSTCIQVDQGDNDLFSHHFVI
jgi:hypothetical protein